MVVMILVVCVVCKIMVGYWDGTSEHLGMVRRWQTQLI